MVFPPDPVKAARQRVRNSVIRFDRSIGRWTLCVSTLNHGDQYGQIGSASNSLTIRLTRNPA